MRLTDDDVRAALRRHADAGTAGAEPDPMRGMEERIKTARRTRTLSMALSALSVAVVAVTLPAVVQSYRNQRLEPAAGTPMLKASAPPAAGRAVPVYYLSGGRLAREFRDLGAPADRPQAAVDAMLSLPPLDADYRSGWPAGTSAVVVRSRDGYAVDISTGPLDGCVALQQLVHTVTAASGSDGPVLVRVAGRSVAGRTGVESCGADRSGAVARRPQREILVDVQISSPNDGARVPRSFELTGHSRVTDGSLRWVVIDELTGRELARGSPAGLGDSPAGWTVRVALPSSAGGRAAEIIVSGTAADGAAATDSKRIRIAD